MDRLVFLLATLAPQIANCTAVCETIVVDNCPDASARETVANAPGNPRHVHEPSPGVARARNRGVAEARGRFVVFIDDDQVPDAGWLMAYALAAERGETAVFGPVRPAFEVRPPTDLRSQLTGLFSRDLAVPSGTDISGHRAYLGTGNSMFNRAACFPHVAPFDLRFNGGGEDVWFLRDLVELLGVKLFWCAEAGVEEVVPASRMTAAYVRARKFRNGQLRCIVEAGGGNWLSVGFWMAAGLVQALGYGMAAGLAKVLPSASGRSTDFAIRSAAGLGKVLWWQKG